MSPLLGPGTNGDEILDHDILTIYLDAEGHEIDPRRVMGHEAFYEAESLLARLNQFSTNEDDLPAPPLSPPKPPKQRST